MSEEINEALLNENAELHLLLREAREVALDALVLQIGSVAEAAQIPTMHMIAMCYMYPNVSDDGIPADPAQWPEGINEQCKLFQERVKAYSRSIRETGRSQGLATLVRITDDWPIYKKEEMH